MQKTISAGTDYKTDYTNTEPQPVCSTYDTLESTLVTVCSLKTIKTYICKIYWIKVQ